MMGSGSDSRSSLRWIGCCATGLVGGTLSASTSTGVSFMDSSLIGSRFWTLLAAALACSEGTRYGWRSRSDCTDCGKGLLLGGLGREAFCLAWKSR